MRNPGNVLHLLFCRHLGLNPWLLRISTEISRVVVIPNTMGSKPYLVFILGPRMTVLTQFSFYTKESKSQEGIFSSPY